MTTLDFNFITYYEELKDLESKGWSLKKPELAFCALFEATEAKQRNDVLEEAALLCEQIDCHCEHEPPAGAGAIGAVIRYRDAIRALEV